MDYLPEVTHSSGEQTWGQPPGKIMWPSWKVAPRFRESSSAYGRSLNSAGVTGIVSFVHPINFFLHAQCPAVLTQGQHHMFKPAGVRKQVSISLDNYKLFLIQRFSTLGHF